jgi:hypothetical protein
MKRSSPLLLLVVLFLPVSARGEEKPLAQDWDYAAAMKKVAARFRGRPGVVLHVGDSITHANPYGQWARGGQGRTEADKKVLAWMHAGADNDTDGWWLARFDHPSGGRSHTAAGGIRADEMLAAGKAGLPSLARLLDLYKPQAVVLMLGTNDASANRPVEAYAADMRKAVDLILGQGAVCILSTIPPHPGRPELARAYNDALRQLASRRSLPLIDYEKEILKRRPDDWNGTLLGKNDVHPTAASGTITAASAPTAENLRNSGYLLRGWLSVQKIAEVKRTVFHEVKPAPDTPQGRPEGEAVRVPVSRDTWVSNVGEEIDCNLGGATRLKVKSYQEMTLLDLDPKGLRGRVVRGATLHLRLAGDQPLRRVTVGTVAADWVEGTSPSYQPQKGSSSFRRRKHPDVPWAGPGSDLCGVILGGGGSLWRMADAFPPDAQGWQRVAVDPSIVAARVAGISHGFLVFDDTGSEWARDGERFSFFLFPNRFVHSRESGPANAPYFTVFLGPGDRLPPAAPPGVRGETGDLPAGEAWVSWVTPADDGPAGTVGFFATIDGKEIPRYLLPQAGKPGERVRMRLRDLDLDPGAEVVVAVRAADGAGNVGPATEARVRISDRVPGPLPGKLPVLEVGKGELPRLGAAQVAVLDELDKVNPVSGIMFPRQPEGYLATNHLWNADDRQVRLHAARNEFIAFQVLLRGAVAGVRPQMTFDGADGDKIRVQLGRYTHVATKQGPLPDPIVPLRGTFDVPDAAEGIDGQKTGSLHVEVYVPHDFKAGQRKGRLTLTAGEQSLEIAVTLRVWDFTLPDYLSFLPEMNCYGLPANERDYYRLAHAHRTVLNRLGYHQNGNIAEGCAPVWDGSKLDWAAWDRRFGPYLDGSAFADLPRRGVPVDCFYLPLHENWPTAMEGSYNGDYWAERAFPAAYRAAFVEASRQFAEHCNARGWNDTLFHGFLNNKVDYKARSWSHGSSPWLLDEPASFQDFWALRWFGAAFHEGIAKAPGKAKLVFRCDISRPQWQRTALDGLLDYNVVGGAVRSYHRLVFDRQDAHGGISVEYGGSNAVEGGNVQPAAWCLDALAMGCDGVLPWQTTGNADSWKKADELALFYPPRAARECVVPSVRLKSYRRGQQDVEYLTLWTQVRGEPRWAVGRRVRQVLQLVGQRQGTGFVGEDAGRIDYGRLRAQDLWALRTAIGQALSEAAPAPKRRLVELRTPRRDPGQLPPAYVSAGEVPVVRPAEAGPAGEGAVKVLQGREAVRDVLLDPGRPDQPLGAVPRDNAVTKRDVSADFLVRFDLDRLALPRGAKVRRATVSFYVWDPSSQGRTKVVAFGMKTPWDEAAATWEGPAAGKTWQGGKAFATGTDTGPAGASVVVEPDRGSDTAVPPLEYQVDVTDLVQGWLDGTANHGLALVPVPDRTIDEGNFTRFQVYASEYREAKYTPKLTVHLVGR